MSGKSSGKVSQRDDKGKLDSIVNNEHNREEHERKLLREQGKDAPPLEEHNQREMEEREEREKREEGKK